MPAIPKNVEQSFAIELRDVFGTLDTATTGAPTVSLCKDGAWAAATNAATNTKAGYWTVTLTAAETNYREIVIEAVKAGFVTWSRTIYPEPDYTPTKAGYLTGDAYVRLGAPVGASISADIAAIEAQTDDIGAAGAGLTAVPWNAAWDAEVQSEVADALAAYDPPTNTEMEARTLVAANYATASALDAVDNYIDTEITDIQNRLPAALVGGRMDSSVGAMAANVLTASATHADFGAEIANAILGLADGVETNLTVKQAMQLIASFAAGNATGLTGSTLVFKAANNSGTTRITATLGTGTRTNALNI